LSGIIVPQALAEIDPAQGTVPPWLWIRWPCEQQSQAARDPFATSPTLFDAARRHPALREVWSYPVDETARSLLQHYREHQL
jgi:hypothetical protein